MTRRPPSLVLAAALLLGPAAWAPAADEPAGPRIALAPPPDSQFVLDHAGLLTDDQQKRVLKTALELYGDSGTAVTVLTLRSMAEYGGSGDERLMGFARRLVAQWNAASDPPDVSKSGFLILISVDDRRAWIEFGAKWSHERERILHDVLEARMVPHLHRGRYGSAVITAVDALDAVVRNREMPARPQPWEMYLALGAIALLMVLSIVSWVRSGRSGWGWAAWAWLLAIPGVLLYRLLVTVQSEDQLAAAAGSFKPEPRRQSKTDEETNAADEDDSPPSDDDDAPPSISASSADPSPEAGADDTPATASEAS